MLRLRAGPSERTAGLAFLLFTIMQVPYFAMKNTTVSSWGTMVLLSPLQVTAANVVAHFPAAAPAMEAALLPGAWFREALTPLVRCHFAGAPGSDCDREQRLLFDFERVRRRVQLQTLVKIVQSPDFRGAEALSSGCALITLSSLFALVVTVKSSVAGFALVAAGVMQGAHQPLPPAILVAFLCVYSGFQLGESREAAAAARAAGGAAGRKKEKKPAAAAAGPGAAEGKRDGAKAAAGEGKSKSKARRA